MNRRVLTGLVLAMVLPAIDLMALGAAGPEIAGDLGRLDQIAWLFVSYQLALVVAVPVYGKLGDLRGRRAVYVSAVSVFTVASLVAGLAWSFPVLVAARVVQGIGGGGIISQSSAVVADLVPARQRGLYSWITPTVWTMASFVGPVLGGALAEYASWRLIFLLNLPFGVLALWFVRGTFPDRRDDGARRFDVAGAVMLVVSYGALVFAVSVGGDLLHWSSPPIIAGLVVGAAVLVVFFVHELRVADPVLPVRLLRTPVVAACVGTTFLIGTVNFFAVAFLPLTLQVVADVGATAAGLAILPTTAGIAITSTLVGRAVVRTGHYRIWPAVGSVIFAAGYYALSSLGSDPSIARAWIGTGLLGIGMGAGSPVFMLAMQNAVAQRDLGVVSAMAMFARNTGQVFGVALAGAFYAARLTHHLDRLVPAGQRAEVGIDELREDVDAIRSLDTGLEALVVDAFRLAATDVFTVGAWVGAASVVVALAIPQIRLRETLEEPVVETG